MVGCHLDAALAGGKLESVPVAGRFADAVGELPRAVRSSPDSLSQAGQWRRIFWSKLKPATHAAVMRACPAAMLAETVGPIAALGTGASRHVVLNGFGRRVDDVSILGAVMTVFL